MASVCLGLDVVALRDVINMSILGHARAPDDKSYVEQLYDRCVLFNLKCSVFL